MVNPDELVKEFGADALRMYEMFIGPFNQMVSWDPRGILGTARFLDRVWRLAQETASLSELRTASGPGKESFHKTIKKVTDDIEKMSFNTAVSTMMVFANGSEYIPDEFLQLLAPFAPFMTEELWAMRGHKDSIHMAPWPKYDPKFLQSDHFDLVIQVNGRVRAKVMAPTGISEAEAKEFAMEHAEIKKWLTGDVQKVIFIPNRLINLIV